MGPDPSDVVLLLGSNLGDRERHLQDGIAALSRSVTVKAVSRVHESRPHGLEGQPWFLNVAVRGATPLGPVALLRFVKAIEQAEGRTPGGVRWGPRTLDIDIILMGDRVVNDPDLIVPHAAMAGRRFCLLPVSEIAPDMPVPPTGLTVKELLDKCTDSLEVFPL